jgi:hypothetical protein
MNYKMSEISAFLLRKIAEKEAGASILAGFFMIYP